MACTNAEAWGESQLRKYDFATEQLPRLSCKDKTVYELLKAGVSSISSKAQCYCGGKNRRRKTPTLTGMGKKRKCGMREC